MMCNVQLVLFFDVYNLAKSLKYYSSDAEASVDLSEQNQNTVTEREIQTDLHPILYDKDETYVWNLWDFRRKAIELVNVYETL